MNKTNRTQFYLKEVLALFDDRKEEFIFELKKKLSNDQQDFFLISMLSLILDEDKLHSLKKQLTLDEIQTFNQNIDNSIKLNGENLKKLSLELKKLLLFTKPQISEDAIIKLEKMSPFHLKSFLDNNPSLTGYCLSILSATKLTTLLNEMGHDDLEKLLSTQKHMVKNSSELEKKILAYKMENESPFAKALRSNMATLSIEKEKKVYEQLFDQKKLELIKSVATQSIPSELIEKLPKDQLRESLKEVTAEEHSVFLSLLEPSQQNEWVSIICDEGSKLSTMLEMEIKSLQENPEVFDKNKMKSDQIKLNYFKRIRQFFSAPEKIDLVSPLVDEWMERKKSK